MTADPKSDVRWAMSAKIAVGIVVVLVIIAILLPVLLGLFEMILGYVLRI
jgi:hypothetical protein